MMPSSSPTPATPPRTSLEIYSRLALPDAQASYDGVIGQFPVWTAITPNP